MNIEEFRLYCLQKEGSSEEFPFDNETLVFKVLGKIFALTNVENFDSINLKCEPEKALDLRERYQAVKPGYHMNKKHWNTILIDSNLADKIIYSWIDDSYALVVKGLPKKEKNKLIKL